MRHPLIYTPNWKMPLAGALADPEALSIEIKLNSQIRWQQNWLQISQLSYAEIKKHLGGNVSDIISVLSNQHWQQKTFWKRYCTISNYPIHHTTACVCARKTWFITLISHTMNTWQLTLNKGQAIWHGEFKAQHITKNTCTHKCDVFKSLKEYSEIGGSQA